VKRERKGFSENVQCFSGVSRERLPWPLEVSARFVIFCTLETSSATASIESAIEFATALSRCRTIDANDLADDRAADQGRITTRPAVPPATA
jgi:hypothetical protein